MLKYTIGFIKRGSEILMLNRESSPWMGMWNGVGGKIEKNESAMDCILREIKEETGIDAANVVYRGNVTWSDADGTDLGGMYVFFAELPEEFEHNTPKSTNEGILDWKEISWLFDEENVGVVGNIKYFLPKMLDTAGTYHYRIVYQDMDIIDVSVNQLEDVATR